MTEHNCKKEYEDILLEKWNENWAKLFKGAEDTFQAVVGGSISGGAAIGEAAVDVAQSYTHRIDWTNLERARADLAASNAFAEGSDAKLRWG